MPTLEPAIISPMSDIQSVSQQWRQSNADSTMEMRPQPSCGGAAAASEFFHSRQPIVRCELVSGRNNKLAAGIMMAVPFVGCFALFGICNLVAGTIVTIMACKGRLPVQSAAGAMFPDNPIMREQSQRVDSLLDPMKIVGPILLITGATLVLVGLLLGVMACRSVNVQHRSGRHTGSRFNAGVAGTSFGGAMSGPASFAGISGPQAHWSNNSTFSQSPKRTQSLSGNVPASRRQQRHSSPEFFPMTVTFEAASSRSAIPLMDVKCNQANDEDVKCLTNSLGEETAMTNTARTQNTDDAVMMHGNQADSHKDEVCVSTDAIVTICGDVPLNDKLSESSKHGNVSEDSAGENAS